MVGMRLVWGWVVLTAALGFTARGAGVEKVLHNFAISPRGASPYAGVTAGPGGVLYGTTRYGGLHNKGVVYRIDAGSETVLHSFTGGVDGMWPVGELVVDAAGNVYGAATLGGAYGFGAIYKLDALGNETVLHSFTGHLDGFVPEAGVIRDAAGNLYGTTSYGGASFHGCVFKLDPSGNETVLYSFQGSSDGSDPVAGLTRDATGNLYGTTQSGGAFGAGIVFKLDASGNETVLHNFQGGADGFGPISGVIRDAAGNLYGTTTDGGIDLLGTVYKIDASGNETQLYVFNGSDGSGPMGGLIRDAAGNLYGTTGGGGAWGSGVVFKLDSAGNETVLYSFAPQPIYARSGPTSGVVRDPAGNFYGTVLGGGPAYLGYVYKLASNGVETTLLGFNGGHSGNSPAAGLVSDGAGNMYGTTRSGGAANAGVVYSVGATGMDVVYSFRGAPDGNMPGGGLIRDAAGNFYGVTGYGGQQNFGAVYTMDPAGNESVLYSFTGGADGSGPWGNLARDAKGNLYGTTILGAAGHGCVFKLDPSGQETVLYSFLGGTDGSGPYAGVIRDKAGNLYGTTAGGGSTGNGVLFKLDSAGNETVLHSFGTAGDGSGPDGGLILDVNGNLYGTTASGGAYGMGTVYMFGASGETLLYSFTGAADGSNPFAGVTRDSGGNLYGTTSGDGTAGDVFRLDASGHLTVLYSFTGGADGGKPQSSLLLTPEGKLYGTAFSGGLFTGGVVFEVPIQ